MGRSAEFVGEVSTAGVAGETRAIGPRSSAIASGSSAVAGQAGVDDGDTLVGVDEVGGHDVVGRCGAMRADFHRIRLGVAYRVMMLMYVAMMATVNTMLMRE